MNKKPVILIDSATFHQLNEFFNSWNKEVSLKNTDILLSRGIKDMGELKKAIGEIRSEEVEVLEDLEFVELKLPFDTFQLDLKMGDGLDFSVEVEDLKDGKIRVSYLDFKLMDVPVSDIEFFIMNREIYPFFELYYWLVSSVKSKSDVTILKELYPLIMDSIVYTAFFYELCKEDMVEVVQPVNHKKRKSKASKKKKNNPSSFRRVIIPRMKVGKRSESTKRKYSETIHKKKKTIHYVKDEWEREGCWCYSKNGKKYYRRGGICRRSAKSKNIEIILKPKRVKGKKG